jgi:hypothetical protein
VIAVKASHVPETMDYADATATVFKELTKIVRKRKLMGSPEIPNLITEYASQQPQRFQIQWLSEKLALEASKLQADFCSENPEWGEPSPTCIYEISDTNLPLELRNDLRAKGFVPIMADDGKGSKNHEQRTGFITVLAEHGHVAPQVFSIARAHKLDFLFCFIAIIEISQLQHILESA